MYYLVNWIIAEWKHISPEVTVMVLRSAVYPVQWMGLMVVCCAVAVKMETVTLNGKGR